MAIVNCPKCGKEVSETSDLCINCGCSLKNESNKLKKAPIIGMLTFFIAIMAASSCYILYMNNWNYNEVFDTVSKGNFSCILGHDWQDATCTTFETCSVCSVTRGELIDHKWSKATCTEPMICSNCGERDGTALGHSTKIGYCKNCNLYVAELANEYLEIIDYITSGLIHITDGLSYSQGSESSLFAYYCNFQVTDFDFTLGVSDLDNAYEICSDYEEFSKIKQYISEWIAAIPKECTDDTRTEIERYYNDLAEFLEFTKSINAKIDAEIKALEP